MLSSELKNRGHGVVLFLKEPPKDAREEDTFIYYARRAKIEIDSSLSWDRKTKPNNFFGIPGIISDVKKMRALIDSSHVDIINVNSDHDHIVCAIARMRSKRRPVLIRTDHKRFSFTLTVGAKLLLKKFTDGIITFSRMGEEVIAGRFGFPKGRICVTHPALELDRWLKDTAPHPMRPEFGIESGSLVIGMVARFQKYRKTDVVIRAFAEVLKKHPHARLLLLGRSSQMEESVHKPIRELGISKFVITPGHVRRRYRDALRAMDIFVFMVPGSDGTARALREAMALGIPVVAARVGMVPEIVGNGKAGMLVSPTEDEVRDALLLLIGDEKKRKEMGERARKWAAERFDIKRQAEAVERFYRGLVS